MEDLGKSGTSREGQGGAIKLFVLGVAAAVFGLIYFCSTVDAALTWTRENSGAPFGPRYGHASVIHTSSSGSEYIKVIGGHDVGNYLNNVWYWTEGGSWTRFNPPAEWTAREGHTSVDFNNGTGDKLWVMGGYTGSSYLNDVWSSPNGGRWTQVTTGAPMWSGRHEHSSVVFNNRIWVIGGWNGSSVLKDVWSSPDGANWTQVTAAAPWAARARHTSVVYNGRIWVIGGWDGAIVLNDVWSSSDGVNWTRVIANAPWPARSKHTSVAFNNRIWVIGGWNGGAVIKDVWSSFDGASWTQDPAVVPWDARARHTSVVHNNRIWVIGGYTGSSYFNDVWSASSPPTLPPGALCGMAGTCGPVSGGGSCTSSDFDNCANCASGLGDPSTANPCGGCGCGTDCCTVPPGCDPNLYCTGGSPPPPPPAPPVVTGGSAFGTVGQAFTYPINATNSPTSYNATGLPAILSVNTVTGLISGTPAAAGASSVALSATNAGGTGTATLSLTISPPPCGTTICGHVNAAELPANTLQKMVVELRDASGALRKSALTDSTGQYTFNNPPAGSNYVSVATGRNQVASPSQSKPLAVGSAQDFTLRGVAAEIHVTDTPSTFVLITPGAGPLSPPTISQPSGTPPQAYSGTVGLDGKLTLKVPYGANGLYHMTCWKPVTCGTKTVYLRAPAAPGDAPINAGNPVTPGQSPPDISCADTTAPCP